MTVLDRTSVRLVRRLLPTASVIPLVVAWLCLEGHQAGLYGIEFGLALFALSNIMAFMSIDFWIVRSLNRVDGERSQAMAALRQANEQLKVRIQQSEAKFSTAFRVSPAAISIAILPDGRWIEVNEALAKMTGYSGDELIGHTSSELGLVDDKSRAKILDEIRSHGSVRNVEIQMHTKSNEIVEVLVSTEQIELEGQACVLTIQYDISELKRTEAALQASEECYRSLFDNSPIGISIGHKSTRQYVNRAFVRMFGYNDVQEIIGGSALDQVAPQSRQEIIERLSSEPPSTGQAEAFESFGQRKDGTIFPVQIELTRLELADGMSRVIFISDISERKRAETALHENEQKLQTFFESQQQPTTCGSGMSPGSTVESGDPTCDPKTLDPVIGP